jgi:site-specific recombinase XerD
MQWSSGTIKRYKNIKNMLEKFEDVKNYKLTFNRIDNKFFSDFTKYCLEDLKHINNTYLRNIVFFKTFMRWAVKNKYTYNVDFETFNINNSGKAIIKETQTSQIALSIDDLNKLMNHTFKSKSLERVRDVFVFQCVTGMRYGELSLINKSNIIDEQIVLKEYLKSREKYH